MKHKTHVDTVLAYKEKHLKRFDKKETNKKFIQLAQGVSSKVYRECGGAIVNLSPQNALLATEKLHGWCIFKCVYVCVAIG